MSSSANLLAFWWFDEQSHSISCVMITTQGWPWSYPHPQGMTMHHPTMMNNFFQRWFKILGLPISSRDDQFSDLILAQFNTSQMIQPQREDDQFRPHKTMHLHPVLWRNLKQPFQNCLGTVRGQFGLDFKTGIFGWKIGSYSNSVVYYWRGFSSSVSCLCGLSVGTIKGYD